jgi:hypothetical protein
MQQAKWAHLVFDYSPSLVWGNVTKCPALLGGGGGVFVPVYPSVSANLHFFGGFKGYLCIN